MAFLEFLCWQAVFNTPYQFGFAFIWFIVILCIIDASSPYYVHSMVLIFFLMYFITVSSFTALWAALVSSPWSAVSWTAGYLLVGVFYSFARAFFFVRKKVNEREKLHNEGATEWKGAANVKIPAPTQEYAITLLGEQTDRVFVWVTYWPASMINYLFAELVVDFVRYLLDCLTPIYRRIAVAAYNSVVVAGKKKQRIA